MGVKKRRIIVILIAIIVFSLIIVNWTYYLFSSRKISEILNFQSSEITHFVVLEKRGGVASKILSAEDTRLIEIVDRLEVRYFGSFFKAIRVEKSGNIYQLSFYKKEADSYQNLGEMIIYENEYVCVNSSKYKVLDKDQYYELLNLLDRAYMK